MVNAAGQTVLNLSEILRHISEFSNLTKLIPALLLLVTSRPRLRSLQVKRF